MAASSRERGTAIDPAAPRRLGRPRNNPLPDGVSPAEQILDAAATLVEKQGFSATTTRQIAAAAGLEQGSLFHYFPRKNDILGALLERTLRLALECVVWLDGVDLPASDKLYLLCYLDTVTLCSAPHNVAVLLNLPEAKLPDFDSFWAEERKLRATYRRYIDEGIAEGAFGGIAPDLAAELVFAMVETSIKWHQRSGESVDGSAKAVATSVLRLLLSDRGELEGIVTRALQHAPLAPSAHVSRES